MLYELSKAAHLISLFVWVAGVVVVGLALRFASPSQLAALKSYDRAVSTPAMLTALAFGILLALQGNWFSHGWLMTKIVLVVVLCGLHGALVGRLRRTIDEPETTASVFILPLGLVILAMIVLLVTIKPF
jgi:protoporphyrinogen IX oxidase